MTISPSSQGSRKPQTAWRSHNHAYFMGNKSQMYNQVSCLPHHCRLILRGVDGRNTVFQGSVRDQKPPLLQTPCTNCQPDQVFTFFFPIQINWVFALQTEVQSRLWATSQHSKNRSGKENQHFTSLECLQNLFFFFFLPCHMACGSLVPQTGIEQCPLQ